MDIREMCRLADDAGLANITWAKSASVNNTRLSLARNGHIELRDAELSALEKALRKVLKERTQTFNRILSGGLVEATA